MPSRDYLAEELDFGQSHIEKPGEPGERLVIEREDHPPVRRDDLGSIIIIGASGTW